MATFNGLAGNDTFNGSAANDVFNYGSVTYSGSTVIAGRGLDTITSGGGVDRLSFANLGIDHIDAKRVGNDLYLSIQPTADWDVAITTLGGVRVTNFYAASGNGVIDRVDFSDAYVLSTYGAGIWRASIYSLANVLQQVIVDGSAGNDTIVGSAVSDEIGGFGGNDSLSGLAGNDELDGDEGNDTLNGGAGNDTLDGGIGVDTVSYAGANGSVSVNLQAGTAGNLVATNAGSDTLFGIERATGGSHNDQLFGNQLANVLSGGAGNDLLIGNAGNDRLLGGAGSDTFSAAASGSVTGGLGNDTIDGGTVTDRVNYIDGNTVAYVNSGSAVTVNLQTGIAADGAGGTDTLLNINFVSGSAFSDVLTGSSGPGFEQFWGNGGNDTINGGSITDTLNGTMGARAGFDQLEASVVVDLLAGTATGQGNDMLININNVRGSNLADTISGSNRTDVAEQIEGRGGNDVLNGRGGLDMLRYQYASNGVTVNLTTGVGFVSATDQDTFSSFEAIRGSNFNDVLTGGNAASNALEFFRGMGGNDTIDGGAGYDRVEYVDSVQAVVVKLGGAADGTAQDGQAILNGQVVFAGTPGSGTGIDTLRHIEAVRGSDFNDTLTGSAIATQETFEGRAGNDVINGGSGLDRAGYFQALAGVTVTLGANGAASTASDGYGTTDTLRNIENVQGSRDFADRITGNERANVLDGLGGNDALTGGAGNDTLLGGTGNDRLVGGAGKDSLTGGAGLDAFRFSSSLSATSNVDRVIDFVAADDTLQLDDAVFVGIGATGALSPAAFRAGAAAADLSDRVIYNSATGQLFYDSDGSGAAAQVLFATLTAGTALSVADFVIV